MINKKTHKILTALLGVAIVNSAIPPTLAKAEEVVQEQKFENNQKENISEKIEEKISTKTLKEVSNNPVLESKIVLSKEMPEVYGEIEESTYINKDKPMIEDNKYNTGGIEPVTLTELSEEEATEISEYVPTATKQIRRSFRTAINSSSTSSSSSNLYNSTYAYEYLSHLANGSNMQQAYNIIFEYLKKAHNGDINIDSTLLDGTYYLEKINLISYNLTIANLNTVFTSICYDNPEFFWLNKDLHYINDSNGIVKSFIPTVNSQFKTKQSRSDMKDKINVAVQDYLNLVSACTNDYEIELAFQKKMVDETIYDPQVKVSTLNDKNVNNHNIAGVLVDHVAVCESYAKTMQLLFNAKGIENIYVVGKGNGGGHAWNQAYIDGQYYNLDVTWDDLDTNNFDGIAYDYFNSKDDYFTIKHKLDSDTLYPVKNCTSNDASYYNKVENENIVLKDNVNINDGDINKFFVDKIKYYLDNNKLDIRLAGETSALAIRMANYYANNASSILATINSDKCSETDVIYKVDPDEREVRITLKPKQANLASKIIFPETELTLTAVNKAYYIIPQLEPINATNKNDIVWTSDKASVATVQNGVVMPLANGVANIKAKLGTVEANCKVTVNLAAEGILQQEIFVATVDIDPKPPTYLLGVGSSQQLTAKITPENATNKKVIWHTDDSKVASFTENGLLTATGLGTTYIYCTPEGMTNNNFTYSKYPLTVKQADQETLNTLISNATTAVTKAEGSKLQADVDAAKTLVDALPNSTDKTALLNRLTAIHVENVGDPNPALTNATTAVTKAEGSKLQADVDAAKTLVDALPNSTDKTALLNRITAVQNYINANTNLTAALANATTAVTKAEGSKLQVDVNAAKTLVDALPNLTDKTALLNRLTAVQNYINANTNLTADLANATTAVTKAEGSKSQPDVNAAKILVEGLPASATRTALLNRLTVVQNTINTNISNNQALTSAINAVLKAESSKSQADVTIARNLVNQLQNSSDKTSLLGRLNVVQTAIDKNTSSNSIKVNTITINGDSTISTKGGTLALIPNILPVNAANKGITWSSSNDAIASVNDKGIVTAKTDGSVVITAKASDGSGITAVKTITITGQTASNSNNSNASNNSNTSNTGLPAVIKSTSISGTDEVGYKLKAKIKFDEFAGVKPHLEYKWQRASKKDGEYKDIAGATGEEYKLKSSDNNKYIKLIITATVNGQVYTTEEISSKIDNDTSDDNRHETNSNFSNGDENSGNTNDNDIIASNTNTSNFGESLTRNLAFTNPSGRPVSGWLSSNGGNWYYLDRNGIPSTGWLNLNSNWYYLNPTDHNRGAMKTGWVKDNGKWYYLNTTGVLVTNTVIDGYKLGSDGALIG